MCLTGVDYFSTLGYQPGIAALAAGALAPLATLILVLVTLFGALPMYKRVASASPNGDGSISMLERLLSWWQGKLLVLCLIGFMATGFIITITLSAADATAHIAENPFTSFLQGLEVPITLILIGLLGVVFLRGFGEAIGIAVGLVVVYLALNAIVLAASLLEIARNPDVLHAWRVQLNTDYGNPLLMIGAALVLFPKLALGLSGFETGVLVMPLVKGDPTDTPRQSRWPYSQHASIADHGGRDHERVTHSQQSRDHRAHSSRRVPGRRTGKRPGVGLPGARAARWRHRHHL